jgi:serine/threonine protein kinase
MDLCTGGELFDRIVEKGHFYEADAIKIVTVVLEALQYLHEMNIIHRDIKPENLIFRNSDPNSDLMIADFGLSRLVASDEDFTKTTCGTPGYMAPEILEKRGHNKSVDLWSVGVMCYFLLSGYMPFDSKNNVEELEKIIKCKYNFEGAYWKDVSQNGI